MTTRPPRPLRILMATPRYRPDVGGTETHVYEVARRLAESVDVTIVTTDRSGTRPREEISEAVRIIRFPAWPRSRDYYFAPRVHSAVRNGPWDAVHVQSYHTLVAPLAMLGAWRARIPYVVTFHSGGHSSPFRTALRNTQRDVLRPLLARAERLIAVSEFEAAAFQQSLALPAARFAVIPNGSTLPNPGKGQRRNGRVPDEPLIVSVGRLEHYKGHHRLIAALPILAKDLPGVRLRIVGNGPDREALLGQAEALGVGRRVTIESIALEERTAMSSTLAGADAFALLSDYESQGIAVLEAIALGVPAVVSDSTGLGELVGKGLAVGVPPGSPPETIAAALLDQVRHPAPAPRLVSPSWDDCAAQLLAVYEETAEENAIAPGAAVRCAPPASMVHTGGGVRRQRRINLNQG